MIRSSLVVLLVYHPLQDGVSFVLAFPHSIHHTVERIAGSFERLGALVGGAVYDDRKIRSVVIHGVPAEMPGSWHNPVPSVHRDKSAICYYHFYLHKGVDIF